MKNGFNLLVTVSLLFLLPACTTTATPDAPDVESEQQALPELNLSLPEGVSVACPPDDVDYTFLDKGLLALAAGDHIEAVTYFQRYQRLELNPVADWEAGIAIAYDSMLPQSPFYDPAAARRSYQQLRKNMPEEAQFHQQVLMMRDALATFDSLQGKITELQSDKATLKQDLEKREEALRRLRELTLGQKGAAR